MTFYDNNIEYALKYTSSATSGLDASEAQKRLQQNGKNALKEGKKESLIKRFFAQLKDLMIIVLLCASLVSAVIAIIQKEYIELVDSGIILLIVIVNSIIGLVQQSKADKSMEMLKNMNKPFAKVLRNGEVVRVKSEDLVVGDIIVLEAGDSVSADLRLIETASLKIEESMLTGESLAVEKDATAVLDAKTVLGDRKNMAFSSTTVVYGRGKGVVVATAMDTEVGKIADVLTQNQSQSTPLQGQLNKTAKLLSLIVLGITVVIFGVSLIKNGLSVDNIIHSFMTAVAIAVAAIPEGLSASVTIILAISVNEMSRKNAIVRHLQAVETLGCTQIICSDKTGTLTLNKMTVKKLFTLNDGSFDKTAFDKDNATKSLINAMVLCNDTQETHTGEYTGDPTEIALIQYAKENKIDYRKIIANCVRVDECPFDSNRKMMTTINNIDGKGYGFTKGAVDKLLRRCDRVMVGDKVQKLTSAHIEKIQNANIEMADKALRVLAFAIKDSDNKNAQEENMIFVGLVGMIDPPRPEVKNAVENCLKAGICPVMITGDHLNTAVAIAREIGIFRDGDLAITGEELDNLSEKEFLKNLHKYKVFARVSPENKVRIVKGFKHFNYIVAMTGDGVNDAPSIKTADVGVGMGITGTDVSKEVSDVVLTDDNFATIVGAVEEGRKVYSNIQKVIKYLLSANIAEVLCLFVVTLFMLNVGQEFLTPVMILWVNLVTDSLPAIALAYERPEKDIMSKKPRKTNSSLFAGRTGLDIIVQGAIQTVLTLISYVVGNYAMGSHIVGVTMAFVTLCMIQLFHVYNCKSDYSLFEKNPFKNKPLNYAFVIGMVLIVLPVVVPFVAKFFGLVALNVAQWGIAVACALAVVPLVELEKLIINNLKKSK